MGEEEQSDKESPSLRPSAVRGRLHPAEILLSDTIVGI